MRRLVLASSARQYAAPGSLRAFGAEAGGAAGEAPAEPLGRGRGRGTPQGPAAGAAAPGAPGRGRGRGLPEGGLLSRVFGAPAAQAAEPATDTRAAGGAGAPAEPRKPRDGTPREITLRRGVGAADAQSAAGSSGRPDAAHAGEPRSPTLRRTEGGGIEITLRRGVAGGEGQPQAGVSGRPQFARDGESAQRSRSPQGMRRDGSGRGADNVQLPAMAFGERGERRSNRWSDATSSSLTQRQPRGPMPVLPKIPRATMRRPGAHGAPRDSAEEQWRGSESAQEADELTAEEYEAREHKQMLSEFLDIAVDPLFDTSEVGVAPTMWGSQPERGVEEVVGRFASIAEQELKQLGREQAAQSLQLYKEEYEELLQATTDEATRAEIKAELAQIEAWTQEQVEAHDEFAEEHVRERMAQLATDAEMLRDFEYAMAVRNGGSGLPHVAAEEAALAEVAKFADATAGEAYMRRILPLLQRNSSMTYADKQRALGIVLYRVAQ